MFLGCIVASSSIPFAATAHYVAMSLQRYAKRLQTANLQTLCETLIHQMMKDLISIGWTLFGKGLNFKLRAGFQASNLIALTGLVSAWLSFKDSCNMLDF